MNLAIYLISIFLVSAAPALAMDNIEADAAYERGIKEQIRQEFMQGLKLLKAQADGLGMEVREKDILSLQRHMYNKAILMARCVDKGVTFKKTVSGKVILDAYTKGCVEEHLKFIGWLDTAKLTHSMSLCSMQATINHFSSSNPPYDFLGIKEQALFLSFTDYVAMKDCFDNRSERDKLLDR
jgi:hypothetical protein